MSDHLHHTCIMGLVSSFPFRGPARNAFLRTLLKEKSDRLLRQRPFLCLRQLCCPRGRLGAGLKVHRMDGRLLFPVLAHRPEQATCPELCGTPEIIRFLCCSIHRVVAMPLRGWRHSSLCRVSAKGRRFESSFQSFYMLGKGRLPIMVDGLGVKSGRALPV